MWMRHKRQFSVGEHITESFEHCLKTIQGGYSIRQRASHLRGGNGGYDLFLPPRSPNNFVNKQPVMWSVGLVIQRAGPNSQQGLPHTQNGSLFGPEQVLSNLHNTPPIGRGLPHSLLFAETDYGSKVVLAGFGYVD